MYVSNFLKAKLKYSDDGHEILRCQKETNIIVVNYQILIEEMVSCYQAEMVEILQDIGDSIFELESDLDEKEEDYRKLKKTLLDWKQVKTEEEDADFLSLFEEKMNCLDLGKIQEKIKELNSSLESTRVLMEHTESKSSQHE